MKIKKILFVAEAHGNEAIGIEALAEVKKISSIEKFDYVIGNPEAVSKNKRFTEADLNRVYPGKAGGNYEERRAVEILEIASGYSAVIDLHGTVSKTGIFAIITKLNRTNLLLALKFDVKKIVVWPESTESSGSLSTFTKCGIEIESGEKDDVEIKKQLVALIADFLKNYDKGIDIAREIEKREFYTVIGKIEGADDGQLKDWEKTGDFYPLFVGQYENIRCYKLKNINGDELMSRLEKR